MDTIQKSQSQYPRTSQPLHTSIQLLTQPPLPSLEQPFQQHRRSWRMVLRALCALIFVVAVIGNFALLMKPKQSPGQKASRPISIVTLSPGEQAAIYEAAISPRAKILENEFQALQADCKNNNRVACERDLQQVRTDATAFHRYIVQLPVPPCLQAANREIVLGLAYFHNGATLGIQSINNGGTSELRLALQGISQGYDAFKLATIDINQARC